MKIWHWAKIELTNPGSAIGLATDCPTGPGKGGVICGCVGIIKILSSSQLMRFRIDQNETKNISQKMLHH